VRDDFSAPAALSRDPRVQLLGLLRRRGTLTRAELAEQLGVTSAMAGEWIADLSRARLVDSAGRGQSSGGRPPQRVTLAGDAALALGLDVSGWPVRAVLRDLAGRVRFELTLARSSALWRRRRAVPDPGPGAAPAAGPELPPTAVEDVVRLAEHAIRRSGQPRSLVRATGVALAGFVDTRRGAHRPEGGPGGASIALGPALAERLGMPVLIEDMARAAALAEARDGAAAGIADLLFLSLGDRIGAALILDGDLYRGARGVVGEIGHIVVREDGPRCTCGNLGCVQALASRPAILGQVRAALAGGVASAMAGAPGLEVETVVRAAAGGDRLASSVLRQAGQDVGRALAAGANLLGPTMVVLGGYAPALGVLFAEEVRRVLEHHVVPPIAERMRVGVGILGAQAAALGAAWGALDLLVETGALVQRRGGRRPRAAAETPALPAPTMLESEGIASGT
jgi:predicted NBD/HSP70 family sugar kinase/DNA-binding transcriptional ArsR family regulator